LNNKLIERLLSFTRFGLKGALSLLSSTFHLEYLTLIIRPQETHIKKRHSFALFLFSKGP